MIKRKLFERYQNRYSMDLFDPKIAQLDLAYHDIKRGRGVFDVLTRKGLVAQVTTDGGDQRPSMSLRRRLAPGCG